MKCLKLGLVLSLSTSTILYSEDWTGISECGIYKANGIVRSTKEGLNF